MGKKTALVVGASGLVGKELVNQLIAAEEYGQVILWVRRPLGIKHWKLVEIQIDFELLDTYELGENVDHIFCCLGSTIKKAGTKAAFKIVDFEYPLKIAKVAKKENVRQLVVISSLGASSQSKIFYNQVKGAMEAAIIALELPGTQIIRPSLLLGKRAEFRLGEKIASLITAMLPFLFTGQFKKYKPITAKTVACAMVRIANLEINGPHIYESDQLIEM